MAHDHEDGHNLSRRELIQVGLSASALMAAASTARAFDAPAVDVEEASVVALSRALASGRLTSRALVDAYSQRIAGLDPRLASVIELNPEAAAIADTLDAELREKGPRGPLHGIPVLVKDNIATADAMQTTAGSLALVGARPQTDAFVVDRLRTAGAVILGKTNLSEWANFRSTHSSSGWSGRGGQCRNPYALDRSPCGSSSGTGASVAASLAAVGVGTETDGSIVCPSAACSLVGVKPTVGLVSRSGIIPISHTQDTAGPMARTVADAAILLTALAGADAADPATAEADARRGDYAAARRGDYAAALDPEGLRGARIGVARASYFGYSPEADAIVEEAIRTMAAAGAVIVDPADIPAHKELDDAEYTVLLYEFKSDLNAYLQALPAGGGPRTLAELIAWNEAHKDQELKYFGQEIFLQAQEKGPLSDPAYREALATCRRLSREEGLDATFAKFGVDAILAPTGSPPWVIDLVDGDHFLGASSTPAAVSGYPSITVPAGYSFGLPVGVTLIGRPWSEAALLRIAYGFEQASRRRIPPRLLATAEL